MKGMEWRWGARGGVGGGGTCFFVSYSFFVVGGVLLFLFVLLCFLWDFCLFICPLGG